MMMYQGRQIVSVNQACSMVGVSRRTMYNWMASGRVKYVRTAGDMRRVFVDTLYKSSPQPAAQGAGIPAATH